MKFYIVLPAHNEAEFIGKTLTSLCQQTLLPARIVLVDDNSNDATTQIAQEFSEKYAFVSLVKSQSDDQHLPGSKVIRAFQLGLEILDENYDIICKFDADLIFPQNYLQKLAEHFTADPKIGMAGGFCSIEKNNTWEIENLTGKDHIRGALKAYRKQCFLDIGKLKPAMGWDTVDELLAVYHGWKIKTDPRLLVKHLKPTGASYHNSSGEKQGEAFYSLRYGFLITLIASLKLAFKKGKPGLTIDYLKGYFKAKKEKRPFLVSAEEGRFIRNLRWKKMAGKLF